MWFALNRNMFCQSNGLDLVKMAMQFVKVCAHDLAYGECVQDNRALVFENEFQLLCF